MNIKSRRFKAVDIFLIVMIILPLALGVALKVLTSPVAEGISITGAQVYFTVPMPIQDLPITSAQINSVLVIISILFICLYFTRSVGKV